MNLDSIINEVQDPATERALRALLRQIRDDNEANRKAFDDHTHYVSGTSAYTSKPATDSPGNSTGTRETFQQSLK